MKFGEFIPFLYLIYQSTFYLVIGQTVNNEKSDCTKLYNVINGDSKNYGNKCCSNKLIKCNNEGYIKLFSW